MTEESREVTLENIKPLVEENLLEDGYLVPVAFICGKDGAGVVDLEEGMQDAQAKEGMVDQLCDMIKEKEAHKIILVSEAWAYEAPEGMDFDEVSKIASEGRHREEFVKKEIYQITEITADKVFGYAREFTRDESDHIILGKEHNGGESRLDRFKPLQDALAQLQ